MGIQQIHPQTNSTKVYAYKQSWIQLTRPLTLTGTISPIIAGTIVASYNGTVDWIKVVILIISAILIQAAINILNDYFDFKNGQDTERWLLVTNTGQRTNTPILRRLPMIATIILIFAALLGIWLAINSQFYIILIGVIGIVAGYKYSAGGKHSLSALGLGEVTAAIFLGIVPVALSFIVQKQPLGWTALIISLVFAVIIGMMILTNNIRDIEKDEGFRRTIAMRMGRQHAVQALKYLAMSAYLIVTLGVFSRALPWTSLLVYIAIPVVYRLIKSFKEDVSHTEVIPVMKQVAKHHWLFSGLLIIGLVLAL